jgi:hypothetical protein
LQLTQNCISRGISFCHTNLLLLLLLPLLLDSITP